MIYQKSSVQGFIHLFLKDITNKLFVLKTYDEGLIFGGLIARKSSFDQTTLVEDIIYDENAFMFSLVNKFNISFRMNISNPSCALKVYFSINFNYSCYQLPYFVINNTINYFVDDYAEIEVYTFDGKQIKKFIIYYNLNKNTFFDSLLD